MALRQLGEPAGPQAAKLQHFPLVERDGALWIWMGDAALADPSLIIDSSFVVERDRYAVGVVGHLLVHANYLLVINNLLDLTPGPRTRWPG